MSVQITSDDIEICKSICKGEKTSDVISKWGLTPSKLANIVRKIHGVCLGELITWKQARLMQGTITSLRAYPKTWLKVLDEVPSLNRQNNAEKDFLKKIASVGSLTENKLLFMYGKLTDGKPLTDEELKILSDMESVAKKFREFD